MQVKFTDHHENKKKKEEKQKFVYKNVMKYLKNKTCKELFSRQKILKSIIADRFYEKYFASAPSDLRSVVDSFHKNPKGKQEFSFVPKTINKSYFQTLFLIESFKNDFFVYLKTDFLDDYARKIEKKICAYVELKISKVVTEMNVPVDWVSLVCHQIKCNPKWKIPWTFKEAEIAVIEFQMEFNP